MDEKEVQIQKAVGSLPEFTCSHCHKDFTIDEKWIYRDTSGGETTLCTICVTAQFVANRLCGKADGIFTRPYHNG